MREINPTLAAKLLQEFREIQQTSFWDLLMEEYEAERQKATTEWEYTEVGSYASPLLEKWIRFQIKAKSFKEAQEIPLDLEKRLKYILEKK